MITKHFLIRALIIATSGYITGCGGGDSQSSTTTISGRVADGYISGATIFWDCNGNSKVDPNEVKTISTEGGRYIIPTSPAPQAPLLACTLRAHIPATAIDEDTGRPIGSEYLMSSIEGKPEFISPLTTLVSIGLLTEAELKARFSTASEFGISTDYIAAGTLGAQHHNAAKYVAVALQEINGLLTTDSPAIPKEIVGRALSFVPSTAFSTTDVTSESLEAYKLAFPKMSQATNLVSATLDKAEFSIVESAFSGADDPRRTYIQYALQTIQDYPGAVFGNSVNWSLVPISARTKWSTQIQGGTNGFADSAEVQRLLSMLLAERTKASNQIESARNTSDLEMLRALGSATASMGFTTLDSIAKVTNVDKVYLILDLSKQSKLRATILTFQKGFQANEKFWSTISGCSDFAYEMVPDRVPEIASAEKWYNIGLSGAKCAAALIDSPRWAAVISAWSAGNTIGASDGETIEIAKGLSDMVAAIIDTSGIGWASAVYNETLGMYFTSQYYAYKQQLAGDKAMAYLEEETDKALARFDGLTQQIGSAIINARLNRYIKPINATGISIDIASSTTVGTGVSARIEQRVAQGITYKIYWGTYPTGEDVTPQPSHWNSAGGSTSLNPISYSMPGTFNIAIELYDNSLGGPIVPFQILTHKIKVNCPAGKTADPDGVCVSVTSNFIENFGGASLDSSKWTVEGIGGNIATYTVSSGYLNVFVPGGSCGYCGISDGARFKPVTKPLDSNFEVILSVEELERLSRDTTSPISTIQLLLTAGANELGIYAVGDVINNQGTPGHRIITYYRTREATIYPSTRVLTARAYNSMQFRIRRANGISYLAYKLTSEVDWTEVLVPASFPAAASFIPTIVAATGDGGGTRTNSSFRLRFDGITITR